MLLNTFSYNRRRKIENNQDSGLKVSLFELQQVISNLIGSKHQLIVPPTLLAPATHIQIHIVTKPQRPLTCELFFQNH